MPALERVAREYLVNVVNIAASVLKEKHHALSKKNKISPLSNSALYKLYKSKFSDSKNAQ